MRTLLVLVAFLVLVWAMYAFNRLVRLRNQMRAGWADIDVQLTRRHDLVPQLVTAVKAYAGHERATLEAVTELRSRAAALQSPATRDSPATLGAVETELEQALGRLLVLKEAYPELKSNETFEQLQRNLVEIEDALQYARRFYNGAVRDYQTAIQRFPDLLIARVAGFAPGEFFQASDEERGPARVALGS
ncbi:MAG: LemA family protein [Gemmatimonadota bacterium]